MLSSREDCSSQLNWGFQDFLGRRFNTDLVLKAGDGGHYLVSYVSGLAGFPPASPAGS